MADNLATRLRMLACTLAVLATAFALVFVFATSAAYAKPSSSEAEPSTSEAAPSASEPTPTYIDTTIDKGHHTLELQFNSKDNIRVYDFDGTIKNAKSSEPDVVAVKAKNARDAYGAYSVLTVTLKKAGNATISYELDGVAHKVAYRIVSFYNPVKLFKIGKKSYSNRFSFSNMIQIAKIPSGKLVVKPSKKWKIMKIRSTQRLIKNGAKVNNYDDLIRVTLYNGSLKMQKDIILATR